MMNSTLTTVETFIRIRNRRIFIEAVNAPVPSCVSCTSTMSPPPDGPRSIRSFVESGESSGNFQNKCWRRALLDINMQARRTETAVVSSNDPHTFRRAIMRASEVLTLALDDVAGLLSMAQYTGVCPSMIGSCKTSERSRPTSLQA